MDMEEEKRNAFLVMDGERYYARIMFAGQPGPVRVGGFDIMMAIWREPDGPWQLSHRVRTYRSEGPWDNQDEKRFLEAKAPDSSQAELEKCLRMTDMYRAALLASGLYVDVLDVFTADVNKIAGEMSKYQWCHARMAGPLGYVERPEA